MKAFKVVLTLALIVLFGAVSALVQPGMINYQGKLTDDTGVPVTATVSIVFSIYDVATGGTPLWTESQSSVVVQDGIYNVLLGSTIPIPDAVFDGGDRWLGVKVGVDSEMSPRQRIASVGYAINSDMVDGKHASDLGNRHSLDAADGDPTDVVYVDNDGHVGIGTISPLAKLQIVPSAVEIGLRIGGQSGANGWAHFEDAIGFTYELGADAGPPGFHIYRLSSGQGDFIIDKDGEIGIGTTDPSGILDVQGGTAATAENGTNITLSAQDGGIGNTWGGNIILLPGDGGSTSERSGKVGIWTIDPTEPLEVVGPSGKGLVIRVPDGGIGDYSSLRFGVGGGIGGVLHKGGIFYECTNEQGRGKLHFALDDSSLPSTDVKLAATRMTITNEGNVGIGMMSPSHPLHMGNGAHCTAGGVWTDASSIQYKENITYLSTEKAMQALEELNPVMFNFKVDKEEKHVGFIAEDVPELVATQDRKGLSPMEIVAVLTKVVQEQEKRITELERHITELERR